MARSPFTGKAQNCRVPAGALDCGNSGSTMRMLSGILAGQEFAANWPATISLPPADGKNHQAARNDGGKDLRYGEGRASPSAHSRQSLKAIDYKLPVASAQVKTSLLFAGLYADRNDPGGGADSDPRSRRARRCEAFGADLERRNEGCEHNRRCRS